MWFTVVRWAQQLTGATARPVAAQGIKHALVGLGIRHHDARFYQSRLREGQILHLPAGQGMARWPHAARKIFQALGAANITIQRIEGGQDADLGVFPGVGPRVAGRN